MRERVLGPHHPGRVSGVQQRIPTLKLILNLNPKLHLIPKLITVATPPDTHPRYSDPENTHTHTRTPTHPDTHTSLQIRCALGGEKAATISAR